MHVALMLCVFAGSATLTGALIVGDSMRGSLRENALARLDHFQFALRSNRPISERTARSLSQFELLILFGSVEQAERRTRANQVQVIGVDDHFSDRLESRSPGNEEPSDSLFSILADGGVALNDSLARELSARVGEDVLIRLPKPSAVPAESVLGRPDEATATVRLTVKRIIGDDGAGGFSLSPAQQAPMNLFLGLAELQRVLDLPERVNTVLALSQNTRPGRPYLTIQILEQRLAERLRLIDLGLHVRQDAARGYFAIESDQLLVEPAVETAAMSALDPLAARSSGVLSYLANSIDALDVDGATLGRIPYSIVSAVDSETLGRVAAGGDDAAKMALSSNGIVLNDWAASDLHARLGSKLRLTYYVSAPDGGLTEEAAEFVVERIVPLDGPAADPGFLPDYKGISDATSLADWDPPSNFKIDLKRIRPQDEAYWKEHRGTPKAFISLETGQRLWAKDARFGKVTAVRFYTTSYKQEDKELAAERVEKAVLARLKPADVGLAFEDVRARALAAGEGSTDFGMLFVSFSFFLIAAAAMLVVLVFRLNLEKRAGEVGLLLSLGYSVSNVRRLFLLEGLILAVIGSAVGLAGATGYGWLMVAGLRTWWSAAVSAPFLRLHVSEMSLVIGFVSSVAVAAFSVRMALRGLAKHTPRALLAGVMTGDRETVRRGRAARWTFVGSLVVGVGIIGASMATDAVPMAAGFFVGGAALLVAGLSGASMMARGRSRSAITRGGAGAVVKLGLRNAMRQRGRSIGTAGVIACASFVIVAVGASRHSADVSALSKEGGTGGYALMGESTAPIGFDLKSATGRAELGLSDETAAMVEAATVAQFRLKPGDNASCLNLYQVARPRILGATAAFIKRGGFSFQSSMAESESENVNPWVLLDRKFDDGAIPAIGDANTLMWLIKLGIGDDLALTDDRGRARKLRIVGMLSGSVLQGELVVAESGFKSMFPDVSGSGFMLIDVQEDKAASVAAALEKDLERYGVDMTSSLDRLNQYQAIENTYMSVFQTLGGIGLMLGTIGLAAVMLRNILERRGEFALMRALGYRRSRLALMVLSENAGVLGMGFAIGCGAALVAVSPHAIKRPGEIGWLPLMMTILLVFVVGMSAAAAAVRSALRAPLLGSLRRE